MTSQSRSRRVVVAAVALLSIVVTLTVVAASQRLSGEPSTSAPAASTSAPKRSTTTLGFPPYPASEPNALSLYPGRPGAKYDDIELRANAKVSLGFTQARVVGWSRRPHGMLPAGSTPAKLGPYSSVGLVDGYVPTFTHDPGDVARVVLHVVDPLSVDSPPHCVATAASDGAVLVPYAPPPRRPRPTTSTLPNRNGSDLVYFLPLGARRGRIYFTCDFPVILSSHARVVWGLDV